MEVLRLQSMFGDESGNWKLYCYITCSQNQTQNNVENGVVKLTRITVE